MSLEIWYRILFNLILLVFVSLFICKIFNLKKIKNDAPLKIFLLVIGFALTFYIRKIVYNHSIFAAADEVNYIHLLYIIFRGGMTPVSGPGYIFTINMLHFFSKIDFLKLVPAFAFSISTILPLCIYFFYKKTTKNAIYSFLSCILLFSTSYFIWPMIEGRPQQLGMFFVFVASWLFYKYLNNEKYLLPFLVLYSITFFYHILSFLILSGAIFLFGYWKYINKKINIKKLIFPAVYFIACCLIFFNGWFFYRAMNGGVRYLFKNSKLASLPAWSIIFIVLPFIIFVILTILFRKTDYADYLARIAKKFLSMPLLTGVAIFAL